MILRFTNAVGQVYESKILERMPDEWLRCYGKVPVINKETGKTEFANREHFVHIPDLRETEPKGGKWEIVEKL